MAWENPWHVLEGVLAGEDLSAAQDLIMAIDANGKVIKNVTDGAAVEGVLMNKPTAGQPASVACLGPAIVICGAAVTQGDLVASNNAGKAITAAATKYAFARALSSTTAANQKLTVLILHQGNRPA